MTSNLERIKSAYTQWHETRGQSVDTWLDICSENITFLSSAMGGKGMEFTKPCTCLDDVRGYFSGLNKDWEMIHFTVDNYIASGDMIVAQGSTAWRHRETGLEFDVMKADVWTFAGEKAVRFVEHYDSAPIVAALSEGAASAG